MPAHLRNKAAAGAKHASHLSEHLVLAADPVQYSIGEDRIEDVVGIEQLLGRSVVGLYSARARRSYHLRRSVDADDAGAGIGNLFRQLPVAASKVEDALARLGGEPLEHTSSQFMDECAIAAIGFRIPGLLHRLSPNNGIF